MYPYFSLFEPSSISNIKLV